MKFSEFFKKVCDHLEQQPDQNWRDSGLVIVTLGNLELLDVIHAGYAEGVKEGEIDLRQTRGVFCRVDWGSHVANTADAVNAKFAEL